MQAYSQGFAHIYNLRWSGFARQVAPYLYDFYTDTAMGHSNTNVLDLCCGTGQVVAYFLERNFRVVGIDLSEHMLHYADKTHIIILDQDRQNFYRGM